GQHLVPGDDQRAVRRPVLPGAPLRPRRGARARADATATRAHGRALVRPPRRVVSEPMVKAEGVHKRFGRLEVLKGISLEVAPGSVMCVIGPSGSGKSTFLRCINHLENIDRGRLWVDGELGGSRQVDKTPNDLRGQKLLRDRPKRG